MFEAQLVGYLILHLIIRKTIQTLENQELEHHQPIKRWSADIIAVLGFIEDHIKNRSKDFPVDMVIELDERIFQLREFFEQKMVVKKAERIDVFYKNWSN